MNRKEQSEFMIRQLFSQEEELPEIVLEKKRAAYEQIYAQASANTGARRAAKKSAVSHSRQLSKAAGILLACLLAAGGTAVAAGSLLTRWERLKDMDSQEIEQYYTELQHSGNLSFLTSREFSSQELSRYFELEAAYQNNTRLPIGEITRLSAGETYSGQGICLQMTEAGMENLLYLPDAELTDEELLEIIEYHAKQDYALYETHHQEALAQDNWESRLAKMTDEEIDYYYLAFWTSSFPTSDGYRRDSADHFQKGTDLTESESARYQTLQTAYEEKNLFPAGEAAVIEMPQDYSGSGIALCRNDGNFYLPETELTDEEILEIIDFRKKGNYSMYRIDEEIRLGRRNARPSLLSENEEQTSLPEITVKDFASTSGKGKLREISDAKTGDIVRFGSYEQDNNDGNGKEAIEWHVLEQSGDTLTLLSTKILDKKSYHSDLAFTVWEDSDLRKWLNEDFFETAFSPAEQAQICGNTDRVCLLSYEEVFSYFAKDTVDIKDYRIDSEHIHDLQLYCYETLDSRLYAEPTETAKANGLWYWTEEATEAFRKFQHVDYSYANGKSSWWLRSVPQSGTPSAHTVEADGIVGGGQYVNSEYGVRPVIRIKR